MTNLIQEARKGNKSFHSYITTVIIMPCIVHLFQDHSGNRNKRQSNDEIDETKAIHGCEELMNTSIVNLCANVPFFDISVFFNNCVSDALVCISIHIILLLKNFHNRRYPFYEFVNYLTHI